ncbi:MAG: histone deacetylase family protein, partial [bacterium]
MAKVGLIYDAVFTKHQTGSHPENPARVEQTYEHLKTKEILSHLSLISPRPAAMEEITLVHTEGYYNRIACLGEIRTALDPDTIYGPGSFESATNAVGGVLRAVENVMEGKIERAFCLVRPPGHHARSGMAMGFCIFNNVAVGAEFARKRFGAQRIAIIDFDVHHGNGTQEIFYQDEDVLYCSIHQYPFYPGTGSRYETGSGNGSGKTLNVHLPEGSREKDYLEALVEE